MTRRLLIAALATLTLAGCGTGAADDGVMGKPGDGVIVGATKKPLVTTTRAAKTFNWETRVEVTNTIIEPTTTYVPRARSLTEIEAALNCEDALRLKMKYPATADFDAPYMSSGLNSQTVIKKPGGWEFRGKVTTDNAFGTPQTFYYGCRIIGTTIEMAELFAV
jgi:hypothetical protein